MQTERLNPGPGTNAKFNNNRKGKLPVAICVGFVVLVVGNILFLSPSLQATRDSLREEDALIGPTINLNVGVDVDIDVDEGVNDAGVDADVDVDVDPPEQRNDDAAALGTEPHLATITQSAQPQTKEATSQFQDLRHSNSTKTTRRYRGTIYIHPGPLKTATTSIQQAAEHKLLREAAKKDGVALWTVDTTKKKALRRCLNQFRKAEEIKKIEKCKKILQDLFNNTFPFQNGQDNNIVFLSDELSLHNLRDVAVWNIVGDILQDWDVRIVLGYRRYYEWKLSMANQIFKLYCKKFLCDGEEGDHFLVTNILSNSSKFHNWPIHYFTSYAALLPNNISVVNLHEDYDVLERVYCEIIENAPHVCNATKQYNDISKNKRVQNQSVYDGYIWIAMGAIEAGFVAKPKKQTKFIKYVTEKANELGYNRTTLPQSCLSETEREAVLTMTLAHEQAAVPDFFKSSKGEAALRSNFEKALQGGTFCSVNWRETLLPDPRWKDVFREWNETLLYPSGGFRL